MWKECGHTLFGHIQARRVVSSRAGRVQSREDKGTQKGHTGDFNYTCSVLCLKKKSEANFVKIITTEQVADGCVLFCSLHSSVALKFLIIEERDEMSVFVTWEKGLLWEGAEGWAVVIRAGEVGTSGSNGG